MSKNFELLQQIGDELEIFRTPDEPPQENDSGSEADADVRDKILENSTLPDVFENSEESEAKSSEADSARANALPSGEQMLGASQNAAPAGTVHHSRFATGWTGRVVPSPNRHTVQRAEKRIPRDVPSREMPFASHGTQEVLEKLNSESRPHSRKRIERSSRLWQGLSTHWFDPIRMAVMGWAFKLPLAKPLLPCDRALIVQEEEIKLVHRVFRQNDQRAPRVVLFSGLEQDAGCASICARTAKLLAARADGRVCVVDANFKSPSLHQFFFMDNLKGLAQATLETGPITSFAHRLAESSNLWVMPCGKTSVGSKLPLISDRLKSRINELREEFRYVVIHAGPVRLDADSLYLRSWTDGVVLVLEANSTRRDSARRVKEYLSAANVAVLGVVLKNRSYPVPAAIYQRL